MESCPFRLRPLTMALLATGLSLPFASHAQLNNYGATGIYQIPTADVNAFGTLSWGYNNFLAEDDYRDDGTLGENVLFNFGVFPNVEMNLRLLHIYDEDHQKDVYGDFYTRDLSGNLKWKLPYLSNDTTRFALGTTDITGLAVNFRRHYAVASHRWHNFDFTAGYGYAAQDDTNRSATNALDGVFAGIQYQPFDWLKASVEHESSGERAGVDFFVHQPLGWNLSLQAGAILHSTAEHEDPSFQLGISFPLGGKVAGSDLIENHQPTLTVGAKDVTPESYQQRTLAAQTFFENPTTRTEQTKTENIKSTEKTEKQPPTQSPSNQAEVSSSTFVQQAVHALEAAGLDFIHIGERGNTLIVAYENRLYNWSGLDALAAALNTLGQLTLPAHLQTVELITLERGLAKLSTQIDSQHLKKIGENDFTPAQLNAWLNHKIVSFLPHVQWLTPPKRKNWADLELNLAYKGYYGTEYANWDYSFALNPIARVNLWQGAHISSSHTTGSINSYGFDEGGFADSKIESSHVEFMGHQTLPLFKGASTTLSIGQVNLGGEDYRLWTHQGSYRPLDGAAKFYWYHGSADSDTNDYDFKALGAEYTFQTANLTLGVNAGEFAEEDKSQNYYAITRFGHSTARVSYVTSDIGWDRVDFAVSFPLSFRTKLDLGPVTLSGNNDFSTGFGTVIDNPIAPNNNLINSNKGYKFVGAIIGHTNKIYKTDADSGCLTPSYLNTHSKQLFESLRYTQP